MSWKGYLFVRAIIGIHKMDKATALQTAFVETLLLIFLTGMHATCAVEITRLSMPRWVQNGTEDSVVLDCEYDYSENDLRLVVKWFLNEDPEPIYQWIPELNARHASKRLQGRLNMDYSVSPSNEYTRYRALNILRPTTDLSGRYSCHVVSLANQDNEDQVMVVYAPPKSFDFNYTKVTHDVVNFTCEADGVFPLPKVTLFEVSPDEAADPHLITGVKTLSYVRKGAYSIQISREIRDRELFSRTPGEPTLFECVLSIPGTDYENQRRIVYYPGSGLTDSANCIIHRIVWPILTTVTLLAVRS